MTQQTNTTNADGGVGTTSPTSAQVSGHLTMVQWISLIVAILSAVLTAVQPMLSLPQYAGLTWLPPVVMIIAAAVAAATGWVKAYNVPALLLCGVLLALAGCAANETNRAAQGMIAVQTHASNFDDMINSGAIHDAATAHEGLAIIHSEQAAVKAYYASIQAGDSAGLATAKAALAVAEQNFLDYVAKYHLVLPPATPIVVPTLTLPETPPTN